MKNGYLFLADEISLTDDSVLERLNSLLGEFIDNFTRNMNNACNLNSYNENSLFLEPERTLLLSEKSSNDSQLGEVITARAEFFFLSTMNPGGDYGKKEVSTRATVNLDSALSSI